MRQLISLILDEQRERFFLMLRIDDHLYQFTIRVNQAAEITVYSFEQPTELLNLLQPADSDPLLTVRAALSTLYNTGSVDLPLDLDQE